MLGESASETERAMPQISVRDVKLPKIELLQGLRDMTAEDVARAMPEVRLPKIELPSRADLRNIEIPRVQVELPSKLELPKVEIRRKRSGPPWLLLGLLAGLAAAAWVFLSSPATGPRIRRWMGGARQRAERWGEEMSRGYEGQRGHDADETRAFPAAERVDVQPDPYADELGEGITGVTDKARPLTEGIGSEQPV
jgi:hypothetical protein